MLIDRTTFEADGGKTVYGYLTGTVVAKTARGDVRARAIKDVRDDESIHVAGYVGRYRTSPKPWAAFVDSRMVNGAIRETVTFGRDDRSGRFRKENMISFEPAKFAELTNAAFWAAV